MKRILTYLVIVGCIGMVFPQKMFGQCFCETAARKGGHFFTRAYLQPGLMYFTDPETNPTLNTFIPGLKIGFTLSPSISFELGAETAYFKEINREGYYPLEDSRYLFLPMELVIQPKNAKDRFVPFASIGINHQIRMNSRLYAPEGSSIQGEETFKGYLNTQAQFSGGLRMILTDHTSWNAGIIYRKSLRLGAPQDPEQFIGLQLAFNIHF